MTPPLTKAEKDLLHKIYFEDLVMYGRDKLFSYIQDNYPKSTISRRQIMHYLEDQNVAQLFNGTKPTRDIQATVLKEPYSVLGIDLINMEHLAVDGINYLLTVIDLFSKYAWIEPIKDKEAKTVTEAMRKIIKRIDHSVKSIRVDNGSEFISEDFQKLLKKNNIKCVFSSAGKPWANGQIERFNGIIKQKIKMYVTQTDSNWLPILQKLVDNYNHIKSRVTKHTPAQLMVEPESKRELDANKLTQQVVNENIKKSVLRKNEGLETPLKVGDKVRLKMDAKDTEKKNEKWTRQVFVISKVFNPRNEYGKVFYNVKDPETDTQYTEKLYRNDLQLIHNVDNPIKQPKKYEVSKILDKRVNQDGSVEFLVAWKGYRKLSDRSWEDSNDLRKDVPKLLKQFEEGLKRRKKR